MKTYDEIVKTLKKRGVKGALTKDSLFCDLGVDSLDLMDMVVKMEKELNIRIPDDELLNIKSLGDLERVINELTQ